VARRVFGPVDRGILHWRIGIQRLNTSFIAMQCRVAGASRYCRLRSGTARTDTTSLVAWRSFLAGIVVVHFRFLLRLLIKSPGRGAGAFTRGLAWVRGLGS